MNQKQSNQPAPEEKKESSITNKESANSELRKSDEIEPKKKDNDEIKENDKEKDEDKSDKNKGSKNEIHHSIEDIKEDIILDDIDDSMNNKNSGNYNSSQTVSVSQGYDNTVDSHQLENFNYIEENEKK